MKTITFDPDNGPLTAAVKAGFAQPGTYKLQLWEKNANQRIMKETGNFVNDDDDTYLLPEPTGSNDGRLLQAIIVLTVLEPKKYFVSLTVSQGGEVLGAIEVPEQGTGTTDSHTLFFNLLAKLEAAPA